MVGSEMKNFSIGRTNATQLMGCALSVQNLVLSPAANSDGYDEEGDEPSDAR